MYCIPQFPSERRAQVNPVILGQDIMQELFVQMYCGGQSSSVSHSTPRFNRVQVVQPRLVSLTRHEETGVLLFQPVAVEMI